MTNSKIARNIMFSGPSPSTGMHDKYKFATIKTKNIVVNNEIKTNNIVVNQVQVNKSIKTSRIESDNIISNQVLPSSIDLNNLDLGNNPTFNLADKYYYKDTVSRSRVEIINQDVDILNTIYNSKYIKHIIIGSQQNKFKIDSNTDKSYLERNVSDNHPFINYHTYKESIPEYAKICLQALLLDDLSFNIIIDNSEHENNNNYFLINIDPDNIPLRPKWGPMILNQGILGDCYAFSTSEVISFAYTKLIRELNSSYTDEILHIISNYMLPSMIYIEKLYNRSLATLVNSKTPFDNGGSNIYACYNYLIQDSNILEFQYNYPLLLTANLPSISSVNTQQYLVNEYIDKVINDTPNDILSVAKSYQYYKKILDTSNNKIHNIKFKMLSVLTAEMYLGNDPSYNSQKINQHAHLLNHYKHIILNRTIDLLNNDYAINISFPIGTERFKDSSNTIFNTPQEQKHIEGGHAVVIVGYDNSKNYFIIQNTWGEGNGINNTGYYYLPYTVINSILKLNIYQFTENWFAMHFYII